MISILVLIEEDTPLGVSLMISELSNDHFELVEDFLNNSKRLPLGSYLVTLRSALDHFQDRDIFRIKPGVLYACVKTLRNKGLLKNELFEKTLEQMNCIDENE